MNKNLLFLQKNNRQGRIVSAAGFSLIELLIVVVIIGIIAGIAVSRFQAAVMAANESAALGALKTISGSEATFNGGTPGTIDQLIAGRFIDEGFSDEDGDPLTGTRSGYEFKLTIVGSDYVLSATPQSVGAFGTGNRRFGTDRAGIIFNDSNAVQTHYLTSDELRAGTSVPIEY